MYIDKTVLGRCCCILCDETVAITYTDYSCQIWEYFIITLWIFMLSFFEKFDFNFCLFSIDPFSSISVFLFSELYGMLCYEGRDWFHSYSKNRHLVYSNTRKIKKYY